MHYYVCVNGWIAKLFCKELWVMIKTRKYMYLLHIHIQTICLSSTELNCCEGDVLFLVDSSGSVSSYEHSSMLSSPLGAPPSLRTGRGPGEGGTSTGGHQTTPRVWLRLLQHPKRPPGGFEEHQTSQGGHQHSGGTEDGKRVGAEARNCGRGPGGAPQGAGVVDGWGETRGCGWTNDWAAGGGRGCAGGLHWTRQLSGVEEGGESACGGTPLLCGHRRYEHHHGGRAGRPSSVSVFIFIIYIFRNGGWIVPTKIIIQWQIVIK